MKWVYTAVALVIPSLAYAGSIVITVDGATRTINTNAAQDNKLIKLKNTDNSLTVPPGTKTTAQYVESVIISTLTQKSKEADTNESTSACTNYQSLSSADKTTITTLLGGNPCL